jgi:geranylgeranyl diphosphate synthase, type II
MLAVKRLPKILMLKADDYRQQFDGFIEDYILKRSRDAHENAKPLFRAIEYSLFGGGKRFRPIVCALTANALRCGLDRIWPFAAAVEMIHTYSLIHDDLPCMDNDDYRRGRPTNHKMYGEAQALLAGDALLTEAFTILAKEYSQTPNVCAALVEKLSLAAGPTGMIAGQVIDISVLNMSTEEHKNVSEKLLMQMHALKTGALIRVCVTGVAEIARASQQQKEALGAYGEWLGLAFQLADDILDYDTQKIEASGLPSRVGLDETRSRLRHATQSAQNQLEIFGAEAQGLRDLVEMNLNRKI